MSAATLARVLPYLHLSGGDFEIFHQIATALIHGGSVYARPEFDYPPLAAVLVGPLGFLPLFEARVVWLAISLCALLLAWVWTWRLAGADGTATWAVVLVIVLEGSSAPNLALGQFNPLILGLVAMSLLDLAARPVRSATAIGVAAAIKIWPALLLFAWIPWRPSGRRPAAAILAGAGIAALGVLLPALFLFATTGPPHVALAHGFWFGSPALLNFSAPAAALRASYSWSAGAALPPDWQDGVRASWSLAPAGRQLSLAVSILVLLAGLAAIVWRRRRASPGDRRGEETESASTTRATLLALVALALLAAPISWYHYQLLEVPAFVLVLTARLRKRRWISGAWVALAVVALTRHELVSAVLQRVDFNPDPDLALYRTGQLTTLVGAIWFVVLLLRIHSVARIGASRT
ncbi:MAG: glycosyltransferase family 87 protein [Thermoanaerobaculia bacterium]